MAETAAVNAAGWWYDDGTMDVNSLICPSCSKANPSDMRFCGYCGSQLPQLCPSCGRSVPAGMSFCGYCGVSLSEPPPATRANPGPARAVSEAARPLVPAASTADERAPSRVPTHEERRLVTALFCDLVGFTPLSEQLDPEVVRDIQAAYFREMSRQIERFGGVVEKYAGDAVLALFGTPIAREDDAERAVLCALGMQQAIEPVADEARQRWQVEPALRVGVNTGEVVSGAWEVGGRQDVAVTGDSVNTAARIQGAAEPGEILVGAETRRLTRRRILYGENRDLTLKGKAGIVSVFPALGVRAELGERWEEAGHRTPLVGRERELAQLQESWERAQAGEGGLVSLVGDIGVGKSRLISEFLQRMTGERTLRIIRARSLSYGQQFNLWLIADLLRAVFGLKEQEPLEEVGMRLASGIPALLAAQDQGTQADALDVLGEVLGLPIGESLVAHAGAQVRRQVLLRALRLVLAALAERSPTLVVLEDLHWIDEASQEVLTEILAEIPGLRLLVLASQRPGWLAPWSEWGWIERLTLRPLPEEESRLLAAAVVGAPLSTELEGYVAERAGGNPFFVEEMLRALQEAGDLVEREGAMHLVSGAEERLPSSLREVLLARLDRLDPEARTVVQTGSVIGRSFSVRLLVAVSGEEARELEGPLALLQRGEIAFPHPVGDDLEYVFKHVSMREAAYNTLIHKRRQALHLATARAIAQLYPADEYVEIIAYHYARTEELQEAAEWLERAGDRAVDIYANESAIAHFREATRRFGQAGIEERVLARLDEKLGGALARAGRYDEALEILNQAVATYRSIRDLEGEGRATAQIGWTHRFRGTPHEGIEAIQPLLELLASSGPSRSLASLYLALSYLYHGAGQYREMVQPAERAGELARAVGDERILAGAEMRRGTGLYYVVGQLDEGRRVLQGAIALAEKTGELEVLGLALNNLADLQRIAGELEEARGPLERALEVQKRVGNTAVTGYQMLNLGEVLTYLGKWDDAEGYLRRGGEMVRSIGASWFAMYPPLHRGHLRLRQGLWEESRQHLQEGLRLAEPSGDTQALQLGHWMFAELEVLEGRPVAARQRLEGFSAKDGPYIVPVLAALAWTYLELGELEEAEQAADRGHRIAGERQNRLYLPDVLRVQGMIRARKGRWQEAEAIFQEAVSLARPMPYPYAEARALYEWGLMLQGQGKKDQAREKLEEALGIFQRLGANKDVERTQELLAEFAGR